MKLNKWTVGLAAVGAISLSSAVQAEEAATEMNVVNAMTSGTTISGYVNTSFSYNLNTANGGVDRADILGSGKANGFNLDVVNLTLEKPLDESEWAAGYKAELLFGPDAVGWNPSVVGDSDQDVGLKQAYVNLRTPVGNGLEWKMGVFDTIIGYESFNANANPNYTRSIAWSIEPTQHTGLLAKYVVSDVVSVTAGVADTMDAGINNRAAYSGGANSTKDQWNLTYMAAVAVTAPEDMGALAGSTLYGGVLYGRSDIWGAGGNQTSWYSGLTLATGVEGLSVGAAFDYLDYQETSTGGVGTGSTWVGGLYASFQATEKLSLHARGEYARGNSGFDSDPTDNAKEEWFEGTLTAQYDLWQNVITRLEARWDNRNYRDVNGFGDSNQPGADDLSNAYSLMLNVIYVF
ncbi:MAG: porin [Verrucomicrobia bacterium]|jgi:hypothetical protein|nr:porin [Verrucomicrobiota bacterium]